MKEWYLINPQPTLNSGFEFDEFADYAKDSFDEILSETQLGKDIIFCKGQFDGENFEFEEKSKGVVQSETPDAYTQGWKRQLLTRIGEISDYKYIKYDGLIWLIITEPADNEIYDKCVLHQCNYVLKWQGKNGRIYYYPAVIENASQYNTGENIGKTITLGFNQIMVYMSSDDISLTLNRTKRMFIDYNKEYPLVYKITRMDSVSYSYAKNRVINIVMTEDQYNPDTDSIEHELCDYFSVAEPIAILYTGSPTIRIGGTKTLRADTDINISWSIETDIDASFTVDGNSIKIKCNKDIDYIGKEITVIAYFENNTESRCILTVTGGV